MPLEEITRLFDRAPFRWWVSGGLALERHVGDRWRSHADADVGILRDDAIRARSWLTGRELFVAARGQLRPWDGGYPDAGRHENNLWMKSAGSDHWVLDLTLGSGTPTEWVYRRDPSIRRPWRSAVLIDQEGVPYLAPDLQLLFKSKDPRDKDTFDAVRVLPTLSAPERAFLRGHLPAGHAWMALFDS